MRLSLCLAAATAVALTGCATAPITGPMGFFITGTPIGQGANLGGLAGADAHCQKLAAAAGAGGKTWRAYLSAPGTNPNATNPQGVASVNARDLVGAGPWFIRPGGADRA